MTKTIMLIHGAWLNAKSWENWKAYYEAKGFRVVVPNWPFDDRSPAELRANPHPNLAKTGVKAIVDHYERLIRALPEEPILIGHSAGAVWVQQLLDRGVGVGGVSIDPAPTTGVPLGPHAIVSAAPALFAWNGRNRSLHMTRKFFATRFAQTIPSRAQADELYDRYVVPTAGKVYWDGVVTSAGKIRWDNPDRAPLLLIGGGLDLIADASMTKAIYNHQKRAPSKTGLRIFPDRSHWTCMDPGWEEVADLALEWSLANMRHSPTIAFPVKAA
jgi:alpha-beta hydrolase superfamily lysophospholipase